MLREKQEASLGVLNWCDTICFCLCVYVCVRVCVYVYFYVSAATASALATCSDSTAAKLCFFLQCLNISVATG